MEMKSPVVIIDGDEIQVGVMRGKRFVPIYDCVRMAEARELRSAMNLVWQCATYGMPDPDLKAEFAADYGDLGYGPDDVHEFAWQLMAVGALPADINPDKYATGLPS